MSEKQPAEMEFREFVAWATGYLMLNLGEGNRLKEIMWLILNEAAMNDKFGGKRDARHPAISPNGMEILRKLYNVTSHPNYDRLGSDRDYEYAKALHSVASGLSRLFDPRLARIPGKSAVNAATKRGTKNQARRGKRKKSTG